jgi:hypothetical protein
MIISLEGVRKTTKSTFAQSAPQKIVYFDFDLGVDRVEPKYRPPKDKITILDYGTLAIINKKKQAAFVMKEWDRLLKEYNDALEDKEVKSVAFDTFTAVWELRRLAYLAELNVEAKAKGESERRNLMPQEYFIPNTDMKMLLTQAKIHGKNLILVHHLKEVYKEGKPTGEMEADGFKYTGDLADVVLQSSKRDGKPVYTVKDCGLTLKAEGLEIEEPTFESVETLINKLRNM